jgi:acyl dehydratase
MANTTAVGVDGLKALVGQHLGYSQWVEITQEQVNLFADATGDHQWIHVDTERAAAGPFGGTIAHGFLTLSLIPRLMPQIIETQGFSMGINYGCDRVRFPSPVPVGSKVRAGAVLDTVDDVAGGVQLSYTVTFEVQGQEKPACVAKSIVRQIL